MTKDQKKSLKLSDFQRSVLVGLLLGDGHLETVNGRTYRLRVEHSETQKEYLFWLHDQFKNWVSVTQPKKKVRKDGRVSYELVTCYHGAFRFYAQQFYTNKKKHIPVLFSKMIDADALAIWFMDDGSRKSAKHKTFIIHTLGYSFTDLERVRVGLRKVFDLEVDLHKQRNKTWRLYVPSGSAEKFVSIVYKLMSNVPSMMYKLDNNMPKS